MFPCAQAGPSPPTSTSQPSWARGSFPSTTSLKPILCWIQRYVRRSCYQCIAAGRSGRGEEHCCCWRRITCFCSTTKVGYCQGISFVAGVLLLHMSEEQAFDMLKFLMYDLGIRQQYKPDMISLQVSARTPHSDILLNKPLSSMNAKTPHVPLTCCPHQICISTMSLSLKISSLHEKSRAFFE